MNKNRLFNISVVVVLMLMVVLTFQGMSETRKVAMAAGGSEIIFSVPLCDKPVLEVSSIRRIYVEQMKTWVTYTDGGPTGVDGGLIHLLSDPESCS